MSIWCATDDDAACVHEPGETKAEVPRALTAAACFAFDSAVSAECQRELDFAGSPDTVTTRGNFYGAYPPGFYTVLSTFVGPDIQVSVLAMRVFLSVVFTAFASALFFLLPVRRRPTLVWSWAVTTVPIGLFMLTSINPSSWAIAGVGFGWLALAGYLESSGARKVGLGVLFALAVLMATGARGDAAMYTVLAIAATLVLTMRRTRRFALDALLPLAAVVYCFLVFRVSRPTAAITQGIPGDATGDEPPVVSVFSRIIPTLFEVPELWMGIFGKGWGLGWVDTSMPALVWLGALACFVGAGVYAATRADVRKALVLIGGALVLLAFPTVVLVAAGEGVGENLQPRYLLPLIVLLAGAMFWETDGKPISFSVPQRALVIAALGCAQAVALYLQLSRYVVGFDDLGPDLDGSIEWWWDGFASPMSVWIVGSLSFAALLAVVLGRSEVRR